MENWAGELQHDTITNDNREAFNTFASKYDTPQEAAVAGFHAQTKIGKPRLPKSMDEFPDDVAKGEFTSEARTLLGIDVPKDTESMKDFDFKTGLAEGAVVDDNFVSLVKDWAVEQGVDKASLAKMTAFYNGPLTEYSKKAYAEQQERQKEDAAKSCNEALIAHKDFGSAEKVQEQSELMRRAIQNSAGLSAEEYEEVGNEMADSILTKNPVMARAMLTLLAPLAAEGGTHGGEGVGGTGHTITPYEYKKQQFPKSQGLWGKETDSWDNESIAMRKQAGIT